MAHLVQWHPNPGQAIPMRLVTGVMPRRRLQPLANDLCDLHRIERITVPDHLYKLVVDHWFDRSVEVQITPRGDGDFDLTVVFAARTETDNEGTEQIYSSLIHAACEAVGQSTGSVIHLNAQPALYGQLTS